MFEFAGEQYLPARPGPVHFPEMTWADYYEEIAPRDRLDTADPGTGDAVPESDEEAPVIITVPAHEIEEGWPNTLSTWRKRLIAGGWDFKMGHSQAEVADVWLADGSAVRYPAWTCDNYWINAVRDDDYVTIAYTLKNGKTDSSKTMRRSEKYWYRKFNDKEMQEHIA